MTTSVAHVVHYALPVAYAGEKNWFILVLDLAIWSTFFGLPGPLPVFIYVDSGLSTTRTASFL